MTYWYEDRERARVEALAVLVLVVAYRVFRHRILVWHFWHTAPHE
jgi:hypothetical protein